MAESDLVVRGVIDDFCFVERKEGPIGDYCGIRLGVRETFKGDPSPLVSFFARDCGDLAKLQRDARRLGRARGRLDNLWLDFRFRLELHHILRHGVTGLARRPSAPAR